MTKWLASTNRRLFLQSNAVYIIREPIATCVSTIAVNPVTPIARVAKVLTIPAFSQAVEEVFEVVSLLVIIFYSIEFCSRILLFIFSMSQCNIRWILGLFYDRFFLRSSRVVINIKYSFLCLLRPDCLVRSRQINILYYRDKTA